MNNPSIKGLGTDIIQIERIKKALLHHGKPILDRLFTKEEQLYCEKHKDPYPHYAVRFSAKESVVKALGIKLGQKIHWTDIEIKKEISGKPFVCFSDKIQKLFQDPKVLISLSHCKEYATAVAIWSA